MEKFTSLTGVAAVMPEDNINTDLIMPMTWLQRLHVDYGLGLFAGRRFRADGSEDPDFILNREPFRHSKILIGGENFACGSSREHAVWGLTGFGIRCVIAPSFGEIFFSNCFRNGVLAVVLPAAEVQALGKAAAGGAPVTVDLGQCKISMADGAHWPFTLDPVRRDMLLAGVDEIAFALSHLPSIEAHEAEDRRKAPWRYASLAAPHQEN